MIPETSGRFGNYLYLFSVYYLYNSKEFATFAHKQY